MNYKSKLILGITCLALASFSANHIQAQGAVMNTATVSLSASIQSEVSSDNGNVTTYAAPIKFSIKTKDILSALAIAENQEGNYPSSSFPSGAKLVVFLTGGDSSSPDFEVVDKSNNFLVDVSDIVSGTPSGSAYVYSGKVSDDTGLGSPSQTDIQIYTITYDDTGIDGSLNLQFTLTGVLTELVSDGKVNLSTGLYTESQSHKLTLGTGDGSFSGQAIIVSGTTSLAGKGVLAY